MCSVGKQTLFQIKCSMGLYVTFSSYEFISQYSFCKRDLRVLIFNGGWQLIYFLLNLANWMLKRGWHIKMPLNFQIHL